MEILVSDSEYEKVDMRERERERKYESGNLWERKYVKLSEDKKVAQNNKIKLNLHEESVSN